MQYFNQVRGSTQPNNFITFKSRANPIRPFILKTPKGHLYFEEPSLEVINSRGYVAKLTRFFCKNFASLTSDPFWIPFGEAKLSKEYQKHFRNNVRYFKNILSRKDDDITLLVATDPQKKIQAAILSFGLEDLPYCKKSVYYIEDIAVNPDYRKNGIGKILIDKTINSVKKSFTDVFLTGEVLAENFYNKLGFTHLDSNNPAQKCVIDNLAIVREDYPDFVSFLTKPIQKDKPRWYEVLSAKL